MDINDTDLGEYQIKGTYSYVELQKLAETKLMKSAKRLFATFVTIISLMVFIIALSFIIVIVFDKVPIFNNFFGYAYLLVLGFTMFFGLWSIYDILKKARRVNNTYKFDMRAIKEKLEKSEIYMEIPMEDYIKFDSPYHLLEWYYKHKKEYENLE